MPFYPGQGSQLRNVFPYLLFLGDFSKQSGCHPISQLALAYGCGIFPFSNKLKQWGNQAAETRRRNCAVLLP